MRRLPVLFAYPGFPQYGYGKYFKWPSQREEVTGYLKNIAGYHAVIHPELADELKHLVIKYCDTWEESLKHQGLDISESEYLRGLEVADRVTKRVTVIVVIIFLLIFAILGAINFYG